MRTRPYLAFGWFWYSVMLLPVIGLIQVGNQAQADRYTYLPLIGVFTMIAWGALARSLRRRFQKEAIAMGAIAVVIACVLVTRHQIEYWKDSRTLFRHALAVDPRNGMAHYALGTALRDEGQTDDALVEFRLAVRDAPGFAPARLNLGVTLGSQGRIDEAIEELGAAARLAPNDLDARYNLGVALMSGKRYDEALTQFGVALRIKPGYERAEKDIQVVLAAKAAASGPKSARK
jgi:tetratricopeptide (TPR) repeat protein